MLRNFQITYDVADCITRTTCTRHETIITRREPLPNACLLNYPILKDDKTMASTEETVFLTGLKSSPRRRTTVSYTHLDVYKRQPTDEMQVVFRVE